MTIEHKFHFSAKASLLVLALATSGLILSGCNRGGGEDAKKTAATKAGVVEKKDIATQVGIAPAAIGNVAETVDVTGPLIAQDDVTVSVKASGKITAVLVREGDTVSQGQLLAQQDTVDLQNNLIVQRANLESARTKLAQAEAQYRQSLTNLTLTGSQTLSAVRQAKAALESAVQQQKITQEGARKQERQQADENVKGALADRDKARSDLKRYQNLYRQQAVSAQQLDQAQAASDSAEARFNSATQARNLTFEGARPEEIRRAQLAVDGAKQLYITAQANRSQVSLRRADITNARAVVDAGRAGISQAAANVRIAQQAITDTELRSPISGVVAERKAEPGQQLTTAKGDVVRIVGLNSIYFDASLSETQYSKIQVGQPVAVNVYALPSKNFKGKVDKVFPVASASRSFTVRISLVNEGNQLRPQMFASSKITVNQRNNVVVVPREALLDIKANKAHIFLNANGKAEQREVTLGLADLKNYEVVSGLKQGESLVISGITQIQNGDKIEPIKTVTNK